MSIVAPLILGSRSWETLLLDRVAYFFFFVSRSTYWRYKVAFSVNESYKAGLVSLSIFILDALTT